MFYPYRFILVLSLLGLVTACSTPTVTEEVSGEFADQGLHEVASSGFSEAFVRPDADLEGYRSAVIDPLNLDNVDIPNTNVRGTVRADWEITPERSQSLQQAWEQSMSRAFSAYLEPGQGEKTLLIKSALTQVRARPGSINSSSAVAGTQPVPGRGSDVVDIHGEFRLYDQQGGDLLAVIRDVRTISAQQWTRTSTTDMVSVFNTWAALLHTRISGR